MKKVTLFFLTLPLLSFSQKFNKKDINTLTLDSVIYTLASNTLAPSDIRLPFKNIAIIDARFDTSKLGFKYQKDYYSGKHKDFKRIKLNGGIQQSLESFYNGYYKNCFNDSAYNLLVVVKKLWIDNFPDNDDSGWPSGAPISELYQKIHAKFEYYFNIGDNFYPAKRLDTVFQVHDPKFSAFSDNSTSDDLNNFYQAIKSMIEINDFNQLKNSISNKKILKLSTVDSFNKGRFQTPLLNDFSVKAGIYASYNELKNNTPSILDFEFKYIKRESFLFDKQTGSRIIKWYALNDKDGLRLWPNDSDNLMRTGNTFEGYKYTSMYVPKTLAGNLLKLIPLSVLNPYTGKGSLEFKTGNGAKLITLNVPRQLDMETGEIY